MSKIYPKEWRKYKPGTEKQRKEQKKRKPIQGSTSCLNIPPQTRRRSKLETKFVSQKLMLMLRQQFCQAVSDLFMRSNVTNMKKVCQHLVLNEMSINFNVLRASVKDRIVGKSSRYVVTPSDRSRGKRHPKVLQQRAKPQNFTGNVRESTILRRDTRMRNHGLLFGRPRYQSRTKEDTIASYGFAIIRGSSPIGIRKTSKGEMKSRLNVNAKMVGTLKISKNSFKGLPMRHGGGLIELA